MSAAISCHWSKTAVYSAPRVRSMLRWVSMFLWSHTGSSAACSKKIPRSMSNDDLYTTSQEARLGATAAPHQGSRLNIIQRKIGSQSPSPAAFFMRLHVIVLSPKAFRVLRFFVSTILASGSVWLQGLYPFTIAVLRSHSSVLHR